MDQTSLAGRILTPVGWVGGTLRCTGQIHSIEPGPAPEDRFIIPGFIDLHVHGGHGADCMDGADAVRHMARFHARTARPRCWRPRSPRRPTTCARHAWHRQAMAAPSTGPPGSWARISKGRSSALRRWARSRPSPSRRIIPCSTSWQPWPRSGRHLCARDRPGRRAVGPLSPARHACPDRAHHL